MTVTAAPLQRCQGFAIGEPDEGGYQPVSPDVAPVITAGGGAPGDPRYLYPFTNCANCGPRYTIIERAYDRATTTMKFRHASCAAPVEDRQSSLSRPAGGLRPVWAQVWLERADDAVDGEWMSCLRRGGMFDGGDPGHPGIGRFHLAVTPRTTRRCCACGRGRPGQTKHWPSYCGRGRPRPTARAQRRGGSPRLRRPSSFFSPCRR